MFVYFVQNVSFVSDVNHYVDQSLATLLLTSGFPTVYRRIYCHKFLTLSNQTLRYIHKCIRIIGFGDHSIDFVYSIFMSNLNFMLS